VSEQERAPAELGRSAAERAAGLVLPASGLVYGAAEIMHLSGQPGALDVAVATALAATAAWGASARWDRVPRQLPAWLAIAGGWLTAAAAEGPLSGWPHPPLTIIGTAVAGYGWWKAQHHEAVTGAREWRAQRAEWLGRSRQWGLGGTHLLDYQVTRLGERYELDTRSTGRRASAFISRHGHGGPEELIAEREGLALSRVHIRTPRPGRLVVSIRRENPWAHLIFHPLFDESPETVLPVPCGIRDRAAVGMDPETGRAMEIPLYDKAGGKNIVIVGIKGSGKGYLLDCISERVTAARDAVQVRINVSIKGDAEAESWGPACHLTAFGPHQKARAVKVLRTVAQILEWRSRYYKRGQYQPSEADPAFVVIVDEADSAMKVPEVRQAWDDLATKGREYGLTTIRAGQRGTTDYGSAKTRSQDDVFVIGRVNRDNEVYLAAGNAGIDLPDMTTYGEGAHGVWGVAELDGGPQRARGWVMGGTDAAQGEAVEEMAQERAFTQPELPAACREFLGQGYEILLSTDVFAKWARAQQQGVTAPLPDGPQPGQAADAVPGTAPAAVPVATLTEQDDISSLDWEPDMDDDMRSRLADIDARLGGVRKIIAETAALPKPPEVPAEAMAASTAERWRQVGEQAQISPDHREILLGLLAGGTTIAAAAEALGVTKWVARTYLERLKGEGTARLDGKGRGSRWRTAESGDAK
jgi:hypothetical protein